MNKIDKDIQDRLDKMSLDDARKAVRLGTFSDSKIESHEHAVALSWLKGKEAELQDSRERKILLWSIISAIAAVLAAIFAFIGMLR